MTDERTTVAQQQRNVLEALARRGDCPAHLATAAASLARKRRRELALAAPILTDALQAQFRVLYDAYAAAHPYPRRGGPVADAAQFARYLAKINLLPPVATHEAATLSGWTGPPYASSSSTTFSLRFSAGEVASTSGKFSVSAREKRPTRKNRPPSFQPPEEHAMQNESDPDLPHRLKTATGIKDPVLVRLTTPDWHILLLAEHLSYDRAGLLRLENVRCHTRRRGWKGLLRRRRQPVLHPHLTLRRANGHVYAGITGLPTVRVGDGGRSFALANLSRTHFEAFRAADARRLLQALRQLGKSPRRFPSAAALWAVHRLRFAVQRVMLPAAMR